LFSEVLMTLMPVWPLLIATPTWTPIYFASPAIGFGADAGATGAADQLSRYQYAYQAATQSVELRQCECAKNVSTPFPIFRTWTV
jgi:hypothetical protein